MCLSVSLFLSSPFLPVNKKSSCHHGEGDKHHSPSSKQFVGRAHLALMTWPCPFLGCRQEKRKHTWWDTTALEILKYSKRSDCTLKRQFNSKGHPGIKALISTHYGTKNLPPRQTSSKYTWSCPSLAPQEPTPLRKPLFRTLPQNTASVPVFLQVTEKALWLFPSTDYWQIVTEELERQV